jgi:hypothetical protein
MNEGPYYCVALYPERSKPIVATVHIDKASAEAKRDAIRKKAYDQPDSISITKIPPSQSLTQWLQKGKDV